MTENAATACPICKRPAHPAHRPFCSKRCSRIDLFRWLGGHYRVPTDEGPEDETENGRPKGSAEE